MIGFTIPHRQINYAARWQLSQLAVVTAALIVAAVALPWLMRQIGMAGPNFLAMQLPVLLAGMLFGPLVGLTTGLLAPLVSQALSGLPPLAALALLIPELAAYGLVAGLAHHSLLLRPWVALLVAMIAGRAVLALAAALLAPAPVSVVMARAILAGWPGIFAQLLIIPPLVVACQGYLNRNDA